MLLKAAPIPSTPNAPSKGPQLRPSCRTNKTFSVCDHPNPVKALTRAEGADGIIKDRAFQSPLPSPLPSAHLVRESL